MGYKKIGTFKDTSGKSRIAYKKGKKYYGKAFGDYWELPKSKVKIGCKK